MIYLMIAIFSILALIGCKKAEAMRLADKPRGATKKVVELSGVQA